MEITNNQVQPVTLEGRPPAKVSPVEATPQVEPTESNTQVDTILNNTEKEQASKQAENLQGAVSQINDYVQNLQRNLQFTVDEATGKDVVTVIDTVSEEVIRQIPSEEALELARRLAANKEDGIQLISTQV